MRRRSPQRRFALHTLAAWVLALCAALPPRAAAQDIPEAWVARFSAFKGKTDCAYGARDCNRCVNDVVEQFRDLTQRDAHVRRVRKWKIETFDLPYPPRNLSPSAPIGPNSFAGHFQSFIRLPTDGIAGAPNLFASYSNAAIFGSRAEAEPSGRIGNGNLRYHYGAAYDHPGGMQGLGQYVLVATEKDGADGTRLEILDSAAPNTPPRVYPLPGMDRAANVSAAKLQSGGYLLLLSRSSYHTDYRLFFTASLEDPLLEDVLPSITTTWDTGFASGWSGDEKNGFENLSMVTECGTGKLYVIGSTAPEVLNPDGLTALYPWGKSIWSLYELVSGTSPVDGKHHALRHITNNTREMYSRECDPRASGTAFAGPNGELALYCHQRNNDVNSRREIVGCGLAWAFGSFIFASAFCGLAVTTNPDMMFTEYWPRPPASPSEVEVTVTVTPLRGTTLGLLEASTGLVCESSWDPTPCTWRVPAGQQLHLVPFRTSGIEFSNAKWSAGPAGVLGGPCAAAYWNNTPAMCALPAQQGLSVGLYDYELL